MNTDVQAEILKYLQDNKSANTFKLARNLGIDRSKIVRELTKLAEKGLIEYRTGTVRVLSEQKPEAVRLEEPKPVQKISQPKTKKTDAAKVRINREIPSASAKLANENKNLRAKIARLKNELEQPTGDAVKLKAAQTHIEGLESQLQHLRRKAADVKTKIIRKVVIRHIPVKSEQNKERSPQKRLGVEARKPSTGPSWLSDIRHNISQLSVPKVLAQKIELKRPSLNLSKLESAINQLEIPELLRKGI